MAVIEQSLNQANPATRAFFHALITDRYTSDSLTWDDESIRVRSGHLFRNTSFISS